MDIVTSVPFYFRIYRGQLEAKRDIWGGPTIISLLISPLFSLHTKNPLNLCGKPGNETPFYSDYKLMGVSHIWQIGPVLQSN